MPSPTHDRYRKKIAFFDRLVSEWATKDFAPDDQPRLRRRLDACELAAGLTVLEPGCGAGRLTRRLAEAVGATGRVIAAEVSPMMANACRRANPDPPVEVHAGPVEDLDIAAESVDRVICFAVFPHIEEKALAVKRFARWLKPGGVIAICHFMSSREINDLHRHAHEAVAADHLPTPADLEAMLAQVSLAVDRAEDEPGWFLVRARRAVQP